LCAGGRKERKEKRKMKKEGKKETKEKGENFSNLNFFGKKIKDNL
jgi:hypothetical protein